MFSLHRSNSVCRILFQKNTNCLDYQLCNLIPKSVGRITPSMSTLDFLNTPNAYLKG